MSHEPHFPGAKPANPNSQFTPSGPSSRRFEFAFSWLANKSRTLNTLSILSVQVHQYSATVPQKGDCVSYERERRQRWRRGALPYRGLAKYQTPECSWTRHCSKEIFAHQVSIIHSRTWVPEIQEGMGRRGKKFRSHYLLASHLHDLNCNNNNNNNVNNK